MASRLRAAFVLAALGWLAATSGTVAGAQMPPPPLPGPPPIGAPRPRFRPPRRPEAKKNGRNRVSTT